MPDTFRTIENKPIFWTDKKGTTHRCEGAEVHRGIRLIWTLCKIDVPANAAWTTPHPGDHSTCITCKSTE